MYLLNISHDSRHMNRCRLVAVLKTCLALYSTDVIARLYGTISVALTFLGYPDTIHSSQLGR